jgi:hypothetical protein
LPLASITGTSGNPAEKPPNELKYSADIDVSQILT